MVVLVFQGTGKNNIHAPKSLKHRRSGRDREKEEEK